MEFMPLDKLGPHVSGSSAHFGIFLPGIRPDDGFGLSIRLIHELDQLLKAQQPFRVELTHSSDADYGDYWQVVIDMSAPGSGRHWGQPGRYVYRYVLRLPNGEEIDWIIDPFAREFGIGKNSSFTYGYRPYAWSEHEAGWRVPPQQDLIAYEINLMEFAGSLSGAAEKLPYLADLGINAVSLMPVTNITERVNWGYEPIGFFGVDERFGRRSDFQAFVDRAHQNGIAVLVDAIYGHTSALFAYEYIYSNAFWLDNPMMGPFAADMFGSSVDWSTRFAAGFFFSVNKHWLEVYHVDGFRYDCVPNYWELEPHFRGFAQISYLTYRWVESQVADGNARYSRFFHDDDILPLVQCAEQLEDVGGVLEKTYATSCWQNDTLGAAARVAAGDNGALTALGLCLGAGGLPEEKSINNDRLPSAPLQYIENHDQRRFIGRFGTYNPDKMANPLFERGDRSRWYKIQPYLIAVLLSKGIPLLYQGQELCENNELAADSLSRIGFLRLVNWEYFFDEPGRRVLALVRRLIALRHRLEHLRRGEHFFYNHYERYQQRGILLFSRFVPHTPQFTLIALNFSDRTETVPFWFPLAGGYREELHGEEVLELGLSDVEAYEPVNLVVPSNYGRVWTAGM